MQIKPINWQIRTDGVVYFEPIGLVDAYFIYPPDQGNIQYEVALIDLTGTVTSQEYFNTLPEAKQYASEKYHQIINQFISQPPKAPETKAKKHPPLLHQLHRQHEMMVK